MEEVTAEEVNEIIQPKTNSHSNSVTCSVSRPNKVGEGINAYVSYVVVVQKPDGTSISIGRRYSDFDWLHDMLKYQIKTHIVPPLPGKVIFDRFTPENVEYRRKELERFLTRVLNHPTFSKCKELDTFLTASEQVMESERLKPRTAQAASTPKKEETKKEGGLFSVFSAISNAVTRPSVELKEVDPWFETQKLYLTNLEQHLQVLVERSGENTKKKQEMVTSLEDFAHAASLACGVEDGNDNFLSQSWGKLSEILNQMSSLTKELVQGETDSFEDEIKDCLRTVTAARVLMQNRDDTLLKLQISQADLVTKNDKHQKAINSSKAPALAQEVKEATNAKEEANEEFVTISDSAKNELNIFKEQKNKQFKNALRDMVTLNMNHQLRMVNLWKELLVDLEEEN